MRNPVSAAIETIPGPKKRETDLISRETLADPVLAQRIRRFPARDATLAARIDAATFAGRCC
jgi:hypothetical protein